MNADKQPRVVIIGAGFAGLYAARTLAKKPVEVILIDRNNFHTFTPLLYQVATCALDPSSIAYPIRSIFRDTHNVHFLMGNVTGIDTDKKMVTVQTNGHNQTEVYDYLLIASGSVTHYFGDPQLQQHTFDLKSLDDAVELRQHILGLFEKAAWAVDEEQKEALTTLVVVGGGATGLETAGALYELYNYVLKLEYDDHYELAAKVILIEGSSSLLSAYPERLQADARKQLESLGVNVWTDTLVEAVTGNHIKLQDGRMIPTYTVVWAAGVSASSLAAMVDIPLQRSGRLPVSQTLEILDHEAIYAAGDIAYLEDSMGQPYPMLIPVAKQQGILVARNILCHIEGKPEAEFRYKDRGIMATIGRSRAVAWIYYRIQLTGFLAWIAWLFLHLVMLLGFRNRLSAFMSWVWNYFTYDRSVRIILRPSVQTPQELVAESEMVDDLTGAEES